MCINNHKYVLISAVFYDKFVCCNIKLLDYFLISMHTYTHIYIYKTSVAVISTDTYE